MRWLCPLPIGMYFWMFLLADHQSLVSAMIILSTEGFSCIVISCESLCYLYIVQFLGLVVSLQCKIRVNCMASREGSANLTCEEMLGDVWLRVFFLWCWDSALLQNSGHPWVGACWLFWLCGISQGSSACVSTEPRACSEQRTRKPSQRLGQECQMK